MTTLQTAYTSFAAPVSTTAATLGVSSQPVTSGSSTGGGNSAVSTGFDPTPATTAVGGGGTTPTLAQSAQSAAGALGTSVANVNNAAAAVNAQFGNNLGNDLVTASGGGVVSDALKSGVQAITEFAAKGMQNIEAQIQAQLKSGNPVDAATMQGLTMKMSSYETIMQMAAKIEEKKNAAIQAWLRL